MNKQKKHQLTDYTTFADMHEFGSELAETILAGVQRMFNAQNKKNLEMFASKIDLQKLEFRMLERFDRIEERFAENDRRWKESDHRWAETKRQWAESSRRWEELKREGNTHSDILQNHEARIQTCENRLAV